MTESLFDSKMPHSILKSAEQVINKKKLDQREDNEHLEIHHRLLNIEDSLMDKSQKLFDRMSKIEEALEKLCSVLNEIKGDMVPCAPKKVSCKQ